MKFFGLTHLGFTLPDETHTLENCTCQYCRPASGTPAKSRAGSSGPDTPTVTPGARTRGAKRAADGVANGNGLRNGATPGTAKRKLPSPSKDKSAARGASKGVSSLQPPAKVLKTLATSSPGRKKAAPATAKTSSPLKSPKTPVPAKGTPVASNGAQKTQAVLTEISRKNSGWYHVGAVTGHHYRPGAGPVHR